MATIGFVGLGHMGNPMVRNLLKQGHQVSVYDIDPDAVANLLSQGAQAVKNISEIAENEVVISMLQTGQQVQDVCSGEKGLFALAKPGTLFIDCSSIDISATRQLHQEAQAFSMAMIEAPVSGGVAGAEAGSLTFMVGGNEKNFQRAKPILEAMGKNVIHAGPEGTGQAAKICNNMILGISMIAVSEAFNLAEKLGLDAQKLFEIGSNASSQCWAMTHYAPIPGLVPTAPANHGYKPGFASKMMLKDLLLSQAAAKSVGTATPLGAEAAQLYSLFVNQGNADLDFSAIIKFLRGKKD
jgi:3-hydroxyisobutyrate dehydrogenase